MKKSEVKAEMLCAYEWICDECGRHNFVSAMTAELTDEDRLELMKPEGHVSEFANEIPDDIRGGYVTYPNSVVCQFCEYEFDTCSPYDQED